MLGLAQPTEGFIHVEGSQGGQCEEKADPISRTMEHRAMGTTGVLETCQFPIIDNTSVRSTHVQKKVYFGSHSRGSGKQKGKVQDCHCPSVS